MWVAELWRYPVKSMAGEKLETAVVGEHGIEGDRLLGVAGSRGQVVTSRTRPALLAHRATIGEDGEPLVDGRPWRSPEVAEDVRRAVRGDAELLRFEGVERFDVLPLLVATDGAIAAFGYDARRLRPNVIIGGVEGLAERTWEGLQIELGEVLIQAVDLRERCIMTTFDPDTQEQDVRVLKHIRNAFGGVLALNCAVIRPGRVRAGDPVIVREVAAARRSG